MLTNKTTAPPAFKKNPFEKFASRATRAVGSTYAFIFACAIIIAWLVSGPVFGYSDTWQLIINTGTTIITFLMVFLIQRAQNKDSVVIQIKLNELVAAGAFTSNRIIGVEDLTEEELRVLQTYYAELVEMTKRETNLRTSHSIEEARSKHMMKMKMSSRGKRTYSNRSAHSKARRPGEKKPIANNNGSH